MIKLVFSAIILMVGACQVEEPEAGVRADTEGEDVLQDREPIYAEFATIRRAAEFDGFKAHMVVKVTFVGNEADKVYVKDLLEEAKDDPVKELTAMSKSHDEISTISDNNLEFSITDFDSEDDPRYYIRMTIEENGENVKVGFGSNERVNGSAALTEERWNELTQAAETPGPTPTPVPLDE